MSLNMDQSVERHIEELSRLGLTQKNSFQEVMIDLADDRRRRSLAYCFAQEDRLSAFQMIFGAKNQDEVNDFYNVTRSSLEVAPMWIQNSNNTGFWGATICVKEPEGVEALAFLSDELKLTISEVAFISRQEKQMNLAIKKNISQLHFPALKSLHMRGNELVADLAASFVERLPDLQRLVINADGPFENILKVLPALSSLEVLEFLGDIDADNLAKAVSEIPLSRLILHGVDFTKNLADSIGNIVTLKSLSLQNCSIKKATFKHLAKGLVKQNQLEEFYLRNSYLIDSKTLENLIPLQKIRILRIEGEDIEGDFLKNMDGKIMEELELSDVQLKSESIDWIASLPALKNLRLSFCGIEAKDAVKLSQLNNLAVLEFEGGRVSPALPSLCTMKNLFRLRLDLHQNDEKMLLNSPIPEALRELDIDGVNLSSAGAAALAKWPLKALNICSDALYGRRVSFQIGSAGAKALSKSTSLEWLNVNCHNIDGEGLKALNTLPHLRWLYLTQNPLGKGIAELSSAPSLRVIYVDDCNLISSAPISVAKIKTLEEINIWDNQIDDKNLQEFAHLPNLREINLVGNAVSPESVDILKQLLPFTKIDS